jgi:hypothetical protein
VGNDTNQIMALALSTRWLRRLEVQAGNHVHFQLLTHSLSVCVVQPSLAAIEETGAHREEYSPS